MAIKNSVRRLLNQFGYEVHRLIPESRGLRTSLGQSYQLMKELGFRPRTVIDVGVAHGTPELYAVFPDVYLLLIEPLEQFEDALKGILKRHKGDYVLAAAGASAGELSYHVHDHQLAGSSLFEESMGRAADGHQVTVPVVTVDEVVRSKRVEGPFLLKADVQGAELDVLDGSQKTLASTEVVMLEVSLFGFMKGAPQFGDVVAYMKGCGFVAWDIILGWNRPLDNALGQVDIAFVKEDGMFRQEHAYATPEQMEAEFGRVTREDSGCRSPGDG